MMTLTESFDKYDKMVSKKENLLIEKEVMENTIKDNPELTRYIRIMRELDKIEQNEKPYKDELYLLMEQDNVDLLDGKNCSITLKRRYDKTVFDIKQFLEDYKLNATNKVYREIYSKYVKQQSIKGNVNVKLIKQ